MNNDTQLMEPMPAPGPKPFETLWFPDGNIVLATDTYLFKVHKSMLSSQSSVFRDMFELPLVDGSQMDGHSGGMAPETFDGLPMVNLANDKGEDLACLLRAVYERQDNPQTPLNVVTSLLLLSTKYDFKHIRKDVIHQISIHYPMTLDNYGAMDESGSHLFGMLRTQCHFSLLGAAFTAQVDYLLPVLYYAASDFPADYILQQFTAGKISLECLKVLLIGREGLNSWMTIFVTTLRDMMASYRMTCPTPGCSLDIPPYSTKRFANTLDLKNIEGDKIMKECFTLLCPACSSHCAGKMDRWRNIVWDKVPILFRYPEWNVLRAKLEMVLSEDV
ncbi:hypothetical protein SCHPADRAFT_944485 [Schizopora paradoxa]|uniref:BTB domain-containing protein n=1 Tax=Schizopora paradoxa TaxID=27342 RepID=A0A0H2RAF4_9AGAM|nr:hypothetical protein SCHPADRAFT_944485 [Schizopora paradoxa]